GEQGPGVVAVAFGYHRQQAQEHRVAVLAQAPRQALEHRQPVFGILVRGQRIDQAAGGVAQLFGGGGGSGHRRGGSGGGPIIGRGDGAARPGRSAAHRDRTGAGRSERGEDALGGGVRGLGVVESGQARAERRVARQHAGAGIVPGRQVQQRLARIQQRGGRV